LPGESRQQAGVTCPGISGFTCLGILRQDSV